MASRCNAKQKSQRCRWTDIAASSPRGDSTPETDLCVHEFMARLWLRRSRRGRRMQSGCVTRSGSKFHAVVECGELKARAMVRVADTTGRRIVAMQAG